MDVEDVLKNCRKNLERGRAVATGIGVFAAVFEQECLSNRFVYSFPYKIFLRKRIEKGSLYNKDLSGSWELPGGGVEVVDFGDDPADYMKAVFNVLRRELMEEGGLELTKLDSPLLMLPAWLPKGNLIDLAFIILIRRGFVRETPIFQEKLSQGLIGFFNQEEINALNIVSPRMKFLISQGISWQETEEFFRETAYRSRLGCK